MKVLINKYVSFINSIYYPIFIASLVLIGHSFSIELVTAIILLTSCAIGLITCCDLKFIIAPLVMFIFMFSQKSVSSGKFYSKPYIIAIIVVGIIIVSLFIFHFVYFRKSLNFKAFVSSKLFLGIILLCSSFLLNGLLNYESYQIGSLMFAIVLIAALGLVFFIFQTNLECNSKTKDYFFFVLFLSSIVLTLELFFSFFHQIQIVDGEVVKESILVGWGMWNNIGGMLAFLLPVHFYFATTVKRFGFIFYITGIVSYIAIILTLSRSSLLVSSLIIAICVVCSCIIGNNKKINRIATAIIGAFGISVLILLWNKISSVLADYLARGFDDNGRFDIYKYGIDSFLSNPLFGGGFVNDYKLDYEFISFIPFRFHNTIIQLLATCGVFGLISYLYHRYTTIKLLAKKRNSYSLFSALCIASLLLCSLLDNHFFNIYPLFIYSLILVVNEKSNN